MPRPSATHITVLVAAFKRGWTLEQIGFAAGVSRQAVEQRLARFERKHGPIERLRQANRMNNVPTQPWKCAGCGKLQWSPLSRISTAGDQMVCSFRCLMEATRDISDEMIERAIDQRWAGRTWTSIAAELGYCIQAVQTRIWKHLYLIGMLNRETVESIWQDSGHHYAWNWLERNTGLICTETGVRIERSVYRDASAWGVKAVREP